MTDDRNEPKKTRPSGRPTPARAGKTPQAQRPLPGGKTPQGKRLPLGGRRPPLQKRPPQKPGSAPAPFKKKKGLVKRILRGFAAMTLLGVLVLVGVAYFVDVESLKGPLIQKLSQSTGLKVEIEGLTYDFKDGFALKAHGVNIESLDGKEKYASAKTLFVRVHLMPLLAGVVEVKNLALIQPVITIYLDQDAPEENKPEGKTEASGDSGTVVGTVRNTFQDFRLAVNKVAIEKGRVYVIKRRNKKPVDQQMVRISAVTRVSRPNMKNLDLTLENLDARLGKLHLKGGLKIHDILARNGNVEINLNLGAFSVDDLIPLYFFLPIDPASMIEPFAPQGRFETLELQLQAPLDALEDGDKFQKQAKIQAHITGQQIAFKTGNVSIPVERMDMRLAWRSGTLNHTVKLGAWSGNIDHTGDLRFRGKGQDPVLNTTTHLDHLNLTQLGLPGEWGLANGFASGTVTATGPARPDAMTVNASLSGTKLLLTPKGLELPISNWETKAVLKGRKLNGEVKASLFGGEITHTGDITLPASSEGEILLDSTLTLRGIDATQLPIPKEAGIDQAVLSGTVHVTGPADPDKWTLAASLAGEGVLLTVKQLDNMPLPVEKLTADATMQGRKIHSKIQASLMSGELVQDGDIILPEPGLENAEPVLNTRLQFSKLDLTRVALPKEWGILHAVLSGDLQAIGPADLERLALSGSLSSEELNLEPNGDAITIRKAEMNVNSKPPKTPISADFQLDQVKAMGYPFRRITGKVSFPPDSIVVHRSAFVPPHGTLGVRGVYNTARRSYDFSFGGKDLSIEDYEKKHLKGKVRFTGEVRGVIPKDGHPARGLNGKLKLLITEGSLKELGAMKAILTILNPTALQKLQQKGLLFDRMGGTFEIKDGVVSTPQMGMEGQYLKVYLKGTADIPTQTLDMQGKALPMGDLDKLLQGVPLLGRFVAGKKIDEGLVETYFTLKGPITDPKVDMETAKSFIAKPKRIFEELGDLLTGGGN